MEATYGQDKCDIPVAKSQQKKLDICSHIIIQKLQMNDAMIIYNKK